MGPGYVIDRAIRRSRRRGSLALLVAAALLAGGCGEDDPGSDGGEGGSAPNIVVVMTDDQTTESMRVMPQTRRLIGDAGTTFSNAFASNPVCCPSRATFLSGQYAHNTGVLRNTTPEGGFEAFSDDETLPVWLDDAGYETIHIGKYLNGYGRDDPLYVPPGWDEWYGSLDRATYRMYGYILNENGKLKTYGDYDEPDPRVYQTDVYAEMAVKAIDENAGGDDPLFLSLAPIAPHSEDERPNDGVPAPPDPPFPNPRPALRDQGVFDGEELPASRSRNEVDVSDKPERIRSLPLVSPELLAIARERYQSRLESLLAVDDMVADVVAALRRSGELDDTVILFVSDNGFLLGEHRIKGGKQFPYEESIRVPLMIRGPGFEPGGTIGEPVANVDLAPTILDVAGAEAPMSLDGVSLLGDVGADRALVIENWCEVDEFYCYDRTDPALPRYVGLRTARYAFMRYPNGERELYDLRTDPDQLESVDGDPAYARTQAYLERLLDELQLCRGERCLAQADVPAPR